LGKHRGRFKWQKHTKHKGNLKTYWTNPNRRHNKHRKTPLITQAIQYLTPGWEPPPDNGKKWVHTLCPFHPDSIKSAAISYQLDAFNCLGCGVKGNPVTLIATQKGINYSSAKRIAETLSAASGQTLPPKPTRKPSIRVFDD
jgi:hypothetical protein